MRLRLSASAAVAIAATVKAVTGVGWRVKAGDHAFAISGSTADAVRRIAPKGVAPLRCRRYHAAHPPGLPRCIRSETPN